MGIRIFLIICLLFLLILSNGYTYQNPVFAPGPSNMFLLGVFLIMVAGLTKKITSS
jgi:hypothetical protein